MENELELLRREIDSIDEKIVELLGARMKISEKVAGYKLRQGMEIYVPEREEQLLERIRKLSEDRFDDYILKIYESILAQSRNCQQNTLPMSGRGPDESGK